uniref:Uncharacterized protein n=1 Tax=Thermofilum pendens TaxID=2269 RepID=A0A7C1NYH5_THEPE
MIELQVRGVKGYLFVKCLEALSDLHPKEIALELSKLLEPGEWVSVVSRCGMLPPESVLVSAAMYALRAYASGKMISRGLEIELLLYLLGERNVSKTLSLLASTPSKLLGLMCLTTRDPSQLARKLEDFAMSRGFRVKEYEEEDWVDFFAEYLGVRESSRDKLYERVAGVLRARAAFLCLATQ